MRSCHALPLLVAVLVGCTPPAPSSAPTITVLHICDWHYVPKEHFAAELKTASGQHPTQEEVDAKYAEFLDEVEAVQLEQIEKLRKLIRENKLTRIWHEGLTDSEMSDYEELVKQTQAIEADSLPRVQGELNKVRELIAALDADGQVSPELTNAKGIESHLIAPLQEQRERRLRLGAPGLLYMNGEIKEIKPLEDEAAFAKVKPVTPEGIVVFDEAANDIRENAIVQRVIDANEPVSLIVLGGGHKLDEDLRQLSRSRIYCRRIELPEYKRLMEKHRQ